MHLLPWNVSVKLFDVVLCWYNYGHLTVWNIILTFEFGCSHSCEYDLLSRLAKQQGDASLNWTYLTVVRRCLPQKYADYLSGSLNLSNSAAILPNSLGALLTPCGVGCSYDLHTHRIDGDESVPNDDLPSRTGPQGPIFTTSQLTHSQRLGSVLVGGRNFALDAFVVFAFPRPIGSEM